MPVLTRVDLDFRVRDFDRKGTKVLTYMDIEFR